ncbi:MAG: TonB-dependent receptor [Bacteroidia bacterium]
MKILLSNTQLKTLALILCVSAVSSTTLVAQKSDIDTALVDTKITARRISEPSQSVPFSLTAFPDKELEERNATQLTDITRFTPNLVINNGQGGAAFGNSIFIRGIGQSNYSGTSDPGVGVFIDGVYIPRTIGTLFEMESAQVEVLRGPQGSMFGRNTIGGAINITTANPTMDSIFGSAELSGGNFNLLQFRGSVNIPISKKVAANISTVYRSRDGYTERILDNSQDQGNDNTFFLRGKVRAIPTDRLVLDLGFDFTRTDAGSMASSLVEADSNTFQFGGIYKQLLGVDPFANVLTTEPYQTNATGASINQLGAFGINGTAKLDLGKVESKLIIGHRNMNSNFAKDGDHSPIKFLQSNTDFNSISTSAELQFYNKKPSKFNWLVGAYYMTESTEESRLVEDASGLYEALEAADESEVAGPYGGANNPANEELDFTRDIDNSSVNNNMAAYANISYDFSKKWTVAGGLRLSNDDKTFTATHKKIASGTDIVPKNTKNTADWTMLTGHFAVEYQATEKILTYLNFAHGFKSGGFSTQPLQSENGIQTYNPETARNLELGVKSDLGKRTRLNFSGFITDIAEIQTDSVTTEEVLIQNRVKGEILGVELEVITRIGKNFYINAFAGLTDARYTIVNPSSGLTLESKFEKTPASQLGIGAAFSPQLTKALKLDMRADYSYQDGTFHDPQNTAALYQSAFSLLSANIGLTIKEKYQIMIWGKNLTDEAVIQGGVNAFGLTEAFYGTPRTYGATLRYKF